MPSSQWATESQAQFRPVAKQFLVPNGRTTARARSSEAAARNEERRKRAMEASPILLGMRSSCSRILNRSQLDNSGPLNFKKIATDRTVTMMMHGFSLGVDDWERNQGPRTRGAFMRNYCKQGQHHAYLFPALSLLSVSVVIGAGTTQYAMVAPW